MIELLPHFSTKRGALINQSINRTYNQTSDGHTRSNYKTHPPAHLLALLQRLPVAGASAAR